MRGIINHKEDTSDGVVQVNPSPIMDKIGFGGGAAMSYSMVEFDVWTELMNNEELLKEQYDVVAGNWPSAYNEVVLIVNEEHEISDYTLYTVGLKSHDEIDGLFMKIVNGEEVSFENTSYEYDDFIGLTFKLVLNADYYDKQGNIWVNRQNDEKYMKELIKNGTDIKIVGIIKPNEEALMSDSHGLIGYTSELTKYVINETNKKEVVKSQKENQDINIFTGLEFNDENTQFDITTLPVEQQQYLASLSQEELAKVIASYMETYGASYADNLRSLGVADLEDPYTIYIYPKNFESKEAIENIILEYNEKALEGDEINYTDVVGVMMSGVTTIIDIISYVLIAFVSISLVVSSIMIGIITYISVLERTKEIGILRAIGASKKDISRVFNAETMIEGLAAGLFGIGFTLVLNIPINIIIKHVTGISNISVLPVAGGIILVLISVALTFIAGLIPSRMASKKDPVEALRTE